MTLLDQLRPITKTARFSLLGSQLLAVQQRTVALYQEKLYSITEARPLLGNAHAVTVRRMIKSGALKALKLHPRGPWRIPHSAIMAVRGETQK